MASNFEHGSTSSKQRVVEFKKELDALGIQYYHLSFSRKITDVSSNVKVYRQIKDLMLNNDYDFVHCHSPIGGVCGRLAAHSTRTSVIYTAHGFHFFEGAPLKNWLLYYPVERMLAYWTDVLITINHEDFSRVKRSFKPKRVEYIPGVGLDTRKFGGAIIDRRAKRQEIGVPNDAILLFSVGELGSRKNHETAIRALSKLNNDNIYYVICGQGDLHQYLKNLSYELGISDRVFLLGFRSDISELCKSSDIYVFPSQREGLGIAALEGMASGLPLISSYINGVRDYTEDGETGFCLEPFDVDGFAEAMDKLAGDAKLRQKMGKHNLEAVKGFDIEIVSKIMEKIYITQLEKNTTMSSAENL